MINCVYEKFFINTYKTVQYNKRPIGSKYDNQTLKVYEDIKKVNNNYISIDETSVELFSKPNKGYAKCVVSKSNKKKR